MKFNGLIVAVVLMVVWGCGHRSDEAARYNDSIIRFQATLMQSFDRLDSALKMPSRQDAQIDYAYLNLKMQIRHAQLYIDSLGPFRSDPAFQISTRTFFNELNGIVENDYGKIISILRKPDSLYTRQLADSAHTIKLRIERNFSQSLQRFVQSQEEFSRKYHIKLE